MVHIHYELAQIRTTRMKIPIGMDFMVLYPNTWRFGATWEIIPPDIDKQNVIQLLAITCFVAKIKNIYQHNI